MKLGFHRGICDVVVFASWHGRWTELSGAVQHLFERGDSSRTVPAGKPGAFPAWWFTRGVIPRVTNTNSPAWPANYKVSDDYSALNQGQLKALAVAAYDEFERWLPGGAGVSSALWLPNTNRGEPIARVTAGEEKRPKLCLGEMSETPFLHWLVSVNRRSGGRDFVDSSVRVELSIRVSLCFEELPNEA